MKELIHKDDGVIVTIFVLIVLPLLVIGMTAITETYQVSGETHQLHRVVTTSVRSAAHMVTPASQAAGTPLIDPDKAHMMFRSLLAVNLRLDENTMQPLPMSSVASPLEYHLLVYNGANEYGVPAGYQYSLTNDGLYETLLTGTGFPYSVSISENGFISGGSGSKQVVLNEPGVVGIVRTGIEPVIAKRGNDAVRWAAATIKTR